MEICHVESTFVCTRGIEEGLAAQETKKGVWSRASSLLWKYFAAKRILIVDTKPYPSGVPRDDQRVFGFEDREELFWKGGPRH